MNLINKLVKHEAETMDHTIVQNKFGTKIINPRDENLYFNIAKLRVFAKLQTILNLLLIFNALLALWRTL